MKRTNAMGVIAILIAGGSVITAHADSRSGLGVRAGTYMDVEEPFVGVSWEVPLDARLSFVPNAEYVFVSRGDLWTINLDTRYELNPSAANPMWVGAGIGMIERDFGFDDSTDAALNLMWGMDFDGVQSRFTPFVHTKASFSDDSEVAISFGIRFGQPGSGATTASASSAGHRPASTTGS